MEKTIEKNVCENEKRFKNSIGYAITLDENDKNSAYLSFTSPLGEVHNIGFTIKSDIVADAMECLADHLKVMVSLGGTDMEKTIEKKGRKKLLGFDEALEAYLKADENSEDGYFTYEEAIECLHGLRDSGLYTQKAIKRLGSWVERHFSNLY